jgi:hypothetical protein
MEKTLGFELSFMAQSFLCSKHSVSVWESSESPPKCIQMPFNVKFQKLQRVALITMCVQPSTQIFHRSNKYSMLILCKTFFFEK